MKIETKRKLQYIKYYLLYGKEEAEHRKRIHEFMDEMLDRIERDLKGVAHTGENKMKSP